MALLPGSPALYAGDTTNAPAYDQRGSGFPRLVNGYIDIGAFEVQSIGTTPSVKQVSPADGPTAGDTTVTISGTNLGTASTATVDFGSHNPASIVSDNGTQLVVVDPAGSGTVNVTVTTASGKSAASSIDQFTYQVMPTLTSLSQAKGASVYGQAVTFTSTVTQTISNGVVPTGTVTFLDGTVAVGTVQLNAQGVATFTTSVLAVGTQSISASYGGDSTNGPSTSTSLLQTVEQASTSAELTTSSNPSLFGEPVSFTATISAIAPGAGNPTGTVTFYDIYSPLQTVALKNGSATFSTASLAVGRIRSPWSTAAIPTSWPALPRQSTRSFTPPQP